MMVRIDPKIVEENASRMEEALDIHVEGPNFSRSQEELSTAFKALDGLGPAVSMFSSARLQPGTAHYQLAYDAGATFARAGYHVITGGGPGGMEAANKGAFDVGGVESIGVGIVLPFEDGVNDYCTIPLEMYYFFNRKVVYARHSQAFVCLPGGIGTIDEMSEIITLVQTKKIKRFPVVLVDKDYWQGLIDWMESRPVAEGKMKPLSEEGLFLVDTPKEAQEIIEKFWDENSDFPHEQAR